MSCQTDVSPTLPLYVRACAIHKSGLKNRNVRVGKYFLILYCGGINEYKW
jgi:hypothetical protein